jgi:hypothetical protein
VPRNAATAGQLTRFFAEDRIFTDNLVKLRAVLIFRSASWGMRGATAAALVGALRGRGLKCSARSLYNWRDRYRVSGFAGIVRRRRSDYGSPKAFREDVTARLVDAATRVRVRGDIAHEYRSLRPPVTYKCFWAWIRRLQARMRVVEIPLRGDGVDFIL